MKEPPSEESSTGCTSAPRIPRSQSCLLPAAPRPGSAAAGATKSGPWGVHRDSWSLGGEEASVHHFGHLRRPEGVRETWEMDLRPAGTSRSMIETGGVVLPLLLLVGVEKKGCAGS